MTAESLPEDEKPPDQTTGVEAQRARPRQGEIAMAAWTYVAARTAENILAEEMGDTPRRALDVVRAALEEQRQETLDSVEFEVMAVHAAEQAQSRLRETRRRLALAAELLALSVVVLLTAVLSQQGLSVLPILLTAIVSLAVLSVPVVVARRRHRRAGQAEVTEARVALNNALEVSIGRQVRSVLAQLSAVPFDELRVRSVEGLSEGSDPKFEVPTRAQDRLRDTLRDMDSASVGLSGPRGVGKSTLLNAAVRGQISRASGRSSFGVRVAAPVRYDADAFISHLFAEVCMRALGDGPIHPRSLRPRAMLLLGAYAGLALIAGGYFVGTGSWMPDARTAVALPLVLLGAGLVVLALRQVPLGGTYRGDDQHSLEDLARETLRSLRTRDTFVRGWSGEAGAGGPLKLGAKREVSTTEVPVTLPELVARYQRFLERVARESPVIVGIDELDKIQLNEEAGEFLNDIKTLFGQPNCFYLVSISEDAMSAFERRGMPVRDMFDSSFDDVVRVEPLDLREADSLIQRRVVGMGAAARALCYVLAGGLPREIIRNTRAAAQMPQTVSVAEVALSLVSNHVRDSENGASLVTRRFVEPDGRQPVIDWLRNLPEPLTAPALARRWDISPVLSAIENSHAPPEAKLHQKRLILELATSAYHAASALEFFTGLSEQAFKNARIAGGQARTPLDVLAGARQAMALSSSAAWDTVSDFRNAVGLPLLPYPA